MDNQNPFTPNEPQNPIAAKEYQTLIETFAQAFWETNAQGIVVKDSPSWRAYTGQTLEEWLNQRWADAVHPQDRSYALAQWQQSIHQRIPLNTEFRLRGPHGSWRWTNVRAKPLFDSEGKITHWVGMNIEITEFKRTEQALRQSEARQQFILESAKDYAFITLDLDRQVTSWSAGARVILGFEEEEIIGKSGDLFFVPEDRAHGAPQIEATKALSEGKAENERWHLRKDGSRFYGSGMTTPLLNEQGTVVGLTKVMRDLTAQKHAEDALQEADRRKDEFLAMLAHELRNPISVVHNGLQVLAMTEKVHAQSQTVVDMLARQTNHLIRMVDDLLDVSRISGDKIKLRKERLNLVDLVRQATESASLIFGQQLQVTLPEEPIEIEGDATRLVQVVMNLITNAVRYTDEEGGIRVSLERKNNEVILYVKDNGIGLAADQLSIIFEPFIQVDKSLARTQGGLGLGLTLVNRLVEKHGGRVEANSEGLGKGSTFTVHLPTLDLKSATPVVPIDTAPLTRLAKVLLVDDNPDVTFTLEMLLELKGYKVHAYNSGLTALEDVERLQPDVVLLDIGMPEMNGYEVCRLIRQQPLGANVFIIALSGYGQAEDKYNAYKAGFDLHLTKPVDIEKLIQIINDR